ncbi:MAG: hypothetical protein P4L59_02880 [Desulfosporosinus sp.]|nr:hypothetical protein [Desulfosporosinus sp.]
MQAELYQKPVIDDGSIHTDGLAVPIAVNAFLVANAVAAANALIGVNANLGVNANVLANTNYVG